jgi:hypothetical protein
MLQPFILIGVGGSGGKTLRAIRHQLQQLLDMRGWDGPFPDAWQFLHIDTPVVQDGNEFPAPALPIGNYLSLTTLASEYKNVSDFLEKKVSAENRIGMMRQIPSIRDGAGVPINKGAGQYRAIGRAVALTKLSEIGNAVRSASDKLKTSGLVQLPRLSEIFNSVNAGGSNPTPVVIFVSSMAGGSGAGQFTDVVEAAKAAVSDNAMNDSYGIFFAPDVFKNVPMTGGVPANSLATISELVNSYWNESPTKSIIDLYNKSGLQVAVEEGSRIGPKFPMIAGASNASTVFKGQEDVYLAIATTIAGWMTDGGFSKQLSQYFEANYSQGSDRMQVAMNTNTVADDSNAPVLNAIGFGRLTLGNEKFAEYSAERFAKSMIDIFLDAHMPKAAEGPVKSSDFYAKAAVTNIGDAFIQEMQLSEETTSNNQIVDALHDTESRTSRVRLATRGIFDAAGATGAPTGKALSAQEWQSRITTQFTKALNGVMGEDRSECQGILEKWIPQIQQHALATTIRYMSTYGIPVTTLLLRDVKRSLDNAAREMKDESNTFTKDIDHFPTGLAGAFAKSAQSVGDIKPGSSVFSDAEKVVQFTLRWTLERAQRDVLEKLIAEFSKDFIERLALQVEALGETVRTLSTSQYKSDGWRKNDVQSWPGVDDSKVLPKYNAASNERLLTPLAEFPKKFEGLVMTTAESESYLAGMGKVLSEMLSNGRINRNMSAEETGVLTLRDAWQPRNQFSEGLASTPRPPVFDGIADPDEFVAVAKKWMLQPGKPFGTELNSTLAEFLDPSLPMNVLQTRQSKFVGEIVEAFKASLPLVKIDNTLAGKIHGKNSTYNTHVMTSAIPLAKSHPSYESIIAALVNQYGLSITSPATQNAQTPQEAVAKMFNPEMPGVDKIDFFSLSGFVMLPIVMDSIMEPIWQAWNTIADDPPARNAFWTNKRARLLPEAIPFDRKAYQATIRGWYIALALQMIVVDESDETRGVKISLKKTDGKVLPFPHPLLYIEPETNSVKVKQIDHLAAVVQSSIIAMALCNQSKNLDPYAAYEELIRLGSEVRAPSSTIAQAVIPDGASDEDKSNNISAMVNFFDKTREVFTSEMDELVKQNESPYSLPLVWELRDDVIAQLSSLKVDMESYRSMKHAEVQPPLLNKGKSEGSA